MRWTEYVACMGENKTANNVLIGLEEEGEGGGGRLMEL
jgi:hypothetical protein